MVAREMSNLANRRLEMYLTHLAERQDKAKMVNFRVEVYKIHRTTPARSRLQTKYE